MNLTKALERAHLVPLLAAVAHISGDIDLLNAYSSTPLNRLRAPVDEDPAVVAEVRGLAQKVVEDRACWRSDRLNTEELLRVATFCAGEPVPSRYAELIRVEANFSDSRRPVRRDVDRHLHAVIVGAGLGGICAAIRLRQAGVSFTVFEKNEGIGGTWWANDYPNLRVDVPSRFYSYSFAPNGDWSAQYSIRDELQAYVESCAHGYGVTGDIRLRHEVKGASWDPAAQQWVVRVQRPGEPELVARCDVLVSAVGMLNRPSIPYIEGLESFEGPWFHSSDWERGLDVTGQRVAVIGTGATSIQLVPGIAAVAGHVDVFQRSRHWVMPNPMYLRGIDEGEQWLLRHLPFYSGWSRFLALWNTGDRLYPALRVDPDWSTPEQSISPTNEKLRMIMTNYLRQQLRGDEELIRRSLPDYPPFGKRILQDGGWFASLRRENVDLIVEPIDHISPGGIVTADGATHDADMIVLATGFHARRYLWPMDISGPGGRLADVWGDSPRAHLGITVPGFPNLFCLYGPNTNPVAGSVIFMLECQVDYLLACLDLLSAGGHASIEVRRGAFDEYNRLLDAKLEQMVWCRSDVSNYFKNSDGHVVTNCPWQLLEYWEMTRRPDPDLHILTPVRDGRP
jgi:4-hydroxyacetophenone monooxygenase